MKISVKELKQLVRESLEEMSMEEGRHDDEHEGKGPSERELGRAHVHAGRGFGSDLEDPDADKEHETYMKFLRGELDESIRSVVKAPQRKTNSVTITVGQLKRLVKESVMEQMEMGGKEEKLKSLLTFLRMRQSFGATEGGRILRNWKFSENPEITHMLGEPGFVDKKMVEGKLDELMEKGSLSFSVKQKEAEVEVELDLHSGKITIQSDEGKTEVAENSQDGYYKVLHFLDKRSQEEKDEAEAAMNRSIAASYNKSNRYHGD